jgi:hypothetical protein
MLARSLDHIIILVRVSFTSTLYDQTRAPKCLPWVTKIVIYLYSLKLCAVKSVRAQRGLSTALSSRNPGHHVHSVYMVIQALQQAVIVHQYSLHACPTVAISIL